MLVVADKEKKQKNRLNNNWDVFFTIEGGNVVCFVSTFL